MDGCDEIVRLADGGKCDTTEACEGDSYSSDRSGLDDGEERPSIEETKQRRKGFPEVDVHTSGLRHHGGQLPVAERSGNREYSGDDPCDQEPSRGANLP